MAKSKELKEDAFRITPKGIAAIAMIQCGLIQSLGDPRLKGFWTIFSNGMQAHGFISEEDSHGNQS